jgi:peptidoglycan/xylan/chitin deacetylase (PgdA/CDA1 family)
MDVLVRWTKPVDLTFASPLAAKRVAAITFDDGFRSFRDYALPELEKRRIPSTLFVVSERLGCYPDWDEYIEDPSFKEPILTADELRGLPSELVRIGSHTLTHPFLSRVTESEARRQLHDSRAQLEKLLNRRVTLFSFPHGDFSPYQLDWCREAGYERVYTILPEAEFSTSKQYAVGRIGTGPADWPVEFFLKLTGAYAWLPSAFRLKRRFLSIRLARKRSDLRPIAG